MKKVIIVGAGLAGSYMAYAMGKKGYEVQVFEKRPDPRKSSYGSGRSINLVVSHRGWTALAYAGIEEEIRKIVVQSWLYHPTNEHSIRRLLRPPWCHRLQVSWVSRCHKRSGQRSHCQ